MARYIDADELLKNLPDDLPYKASVKRVLIQAPTADVVPKSEVEKIFDEIKDKQIIIVDRAGNMRLVAMSKDIAELKKKYTESEDKG